MKAYRGVDVYIHIFLTSALAGVEWSASLPGRFTPGGRAPGIHWIAGWVDLRAGRRGEGKILDCRDSNSDPSVYLPILNPSSWSVKIYSTTNLLSTSLYVITGWNDSGINYVTTLKTQINEGRKWKRRRRSERQQFFSIVGFTRNLKNITTEHKTVHETRQLLRIRLYILLRHLYR
jgi:hypothetical protein